MHALDPGRVPVRAVDPRAHEHHEQPQRVGPIPPHVFVGGLDVAARLRHLAALEDDGPLVPEADHRLVEGQFSQIAKGFGHEAHVQQVQDRVLDAAGVLLHRQPFPADRLVHERRVDLRIDVAVHVPGRVDERVHRVGVASSGAVAFRARRLDELAHVRQGRPAPTGELDVARQDDG